MPPLPPPPPLTLTSFGAPCGRDEESIEAQSVDNGADHENEPDSERSSRKLWFGGMNWWSREATKWWGLPGGFSEKKQQPVLFVQWIDDGDCFTMKRREAKIKCLFVQSMAELILIESFRFDLIRFDLLRFRWIGLVWSVVVRLVAASQVAVFSICNCYSIVAWWKLFI